MSPVYVLFCHTNSQYFDATLKITTLCSLACSQAINEVRSQCSVKCMFPEFLSSKKQMEG